MDPKRFLTKLRLPLLAAAVLAALLIYPAFAGDDGGGALDLDGNTSHDDHVNVGTASNLLITGDLTLEIWGRADSFSTAPVLISRGYQGDGYAQYNYPYHFYISSSKSLAIFWEWLVGDTQVTLTSTVPASINGGEWHHFAVTRNATTKQVYFYVDGVQLGDVRTFTTLPTGGSSARTVIGANPQSGGATSNGFDGLLDEARIWNLVRTQSEIQQNMHKSVDAATSGLVAYYKFDEADGQTINDATTPAENGTLGNTSSAATDDPTRVSSTAPIGNATLQALTTLRGMWSGQTSASSEGMVLANSTFLQDVGDDFLFGHDGASGTTTADLPTTGDWASGDGNRWQRTWYFDKTDVNANGGLVNITFDFSDAGFGTTPSGAASNYRLLKRSGASGQFTDISTASSVADDQVLFTGVDANDLGSYFTLGTTNAPTAATLTQFHARAIKQGVRVKWETGSELQVIGFNVWRKVGNAQWKMRNAQLIAAKTPGAVTGSAYAFTDKKVKAGKKYSYKIEIVLADGSSEWSEVARVNVP